MRSLPSTLLPILGILFATTTINAAPLQQRDPGPAWPPLEGNGCWTDNVGGQRALDKNLGGFDDMTPYKCQTLCDAQGFSLAGVEYGRECFCGNTIFGNNRPSIDICTMTCSGDAGRTCGGPDAISIYGRDDFQYTTGPASALASYNEFANPRCWHDSASSRILTSHPSTGIPADQMTVQKCIDGCAAAGFSSAGLEFGRECFCGNASSPLADTAEMNECNMPCLGDASEFCGGPNRILIYHKSTSPGPEPTPEGSWAPTEGSCWTDSVYDRILHRFIGGYEDLTPAKCQALCENEGFSLAGVEYSRECYCGNALMGDNHPSSGICNMACTGDSQQICGGADAINIYVKDNFQYTVGPVSVLDSYQQYTRTQCWHDDTSNRLLKHGPSPPISNDLMTIQKCIDGCAAAGYSSAGLEFGRECFCDNVSYPPGKTDDIRECNMPCTGDASQSCGGPDRILIYHNNPHPSGTHVGIIQVLNADTNQVVGYLSKDQFVGIMTVQPDDITAEVFTLSIPNSVTSVTQAEITSTSTVGGYPFLGLLRGFLNNDNYIGPGNYQYLFVGTTSHSEPGATPQEGPNSETIKPLSWESSVWNINTVTGDISAQWVNPDGSNPVTYLVLWDDNLMFAAGDPAALSAATLRPTPPIMKFRFIPRS
ncbi:hypothetical protein FRC18_012255 [Serendipita sp. 400]|nr:hypothetical protein FRC18_012255 [Serendipita sp. 400]